MLRIRTVYCLINMLSLPRFTQFYVKSVWSFVPAEPVKGGSAALHAPHGGSVLWGWVREQGEKLTPRGTGWPWMYGGSPWREASKPHCRDKPALPGVPAAQVWHPGSSHIESPRFWNTSTVYFKQIQRAPWFVGAQDNQSGLWDWPFLK